MDFRRRLKLAALLAIAVMLAGCASLRAARMMAPATFGMERITAKLYVEPAMSPTQREELRLQLAAGRAQVERFYGELQSSPYVVACVTQACALRFGSYGGERAVAFGELAIRLSLNGLSAPLVAHEWSHAEFYRRIGGLTRIAAVPRWFDEGVAVVVADEARHAEANWRAIQQLGTPTPALDELITRRQWIGALKKYGETRGDVPGNLRLVYTTAGHEVRGWLACAGSKAVVSLLEAVKAGETFELAYRRLGRRCLATSHS